MPYNWQNPYGHPIGTAPGGGTWPPEYYGINTRGQGSTVYGTGTGVGSDPLPPISNIGDPYSGYGEPTTAPASPRGYNDVLDKNGVRTWSLGGPTVQINPREPGAMSWTAPGAHNVLDKSGVQTWDIPQSGGSTPQLDKSGVQTWDIPQTAGRDYSPGNFGGAYGNLYTSPGAIMSGLQNAANFGAIDFGGRGTHTQGEPRETPPQLYAMQQAANARWQQSPYFRQQQQQNLSQLKDIFKTFGPSPIFPSDTNAATGLGPIASNAHGIQSTWLNAAKANPARQAEMATPGYYGYGPGGKPMSFDQAWAQRMSVLGYGPPTTSTPGAGHGIDPTAASQGLQPTMGLADRAIGHPAAPPIPLNPMHPWHPLHPSHPLHPLHGHWRQQIDAGNE